MIVDRGLWALVDWRPGGILGVVRWRARTWVTVGVPVVVVALLVVAALLVSNQDPVSYPEGSPEAVVQDYFQAIVDDDPRRAYERFTPDLQERCQPPNPADISYLDVARVVLDEVDIDGDEARVRVSVTETFEGGPFGSDESTTSQAVQLERIDGTWGIAEVPWPFFCVRRD